MILRDGNGTIYPIAKDCADSIRDPNWLDLAPVLCIGASTIPLPSCSNSTNLKNQVAVIALVFDNLLLMPRILRCDYDGVKQVFLNLEHDLSAYFSTCISPSKFIHTFINYIISIGCIFLFLEVNVAQIQSVLSERCDGNRNILHACVNMCSPSSNKDNEQGIERELVTCAVDGNSTPMEEPIPPLSWPPELDNTSGEEDSLLSIGAASISMMNKSGEFWRFSLERLFSIISPQIMKFMLMFVFL